MWSCSAVAVVANLHVRVRRQSPIWPSFLVFFFGSGTAKDAVQTDATKQAALRPISTGILAAQELINPGAGAERIINPKMHWSVRDRLGKLGLVDETKYRKYSPKNLPKDLGTAEPSDLELRLVRLCRLNNERGKTGHCALHRDLTTREQGWRGRRIRKLREEWKDVLARE